MMTIDRRTLLATGVVAGLAAAAPALAMGDRRPALLVADLRFDLARQRAAVARADGLRVLDLAQEDLGQAWRGQLGHVAALREGPIHGITLWSSQYICECFAREHGLRLEVLPQVAADSALREWVLA